MSTGAWSTAALPDGAIDVWVHVPAAGSAPAIVLLQEIFGVNAAMRAIAADLTSQGYAVAAPDLFWRLERRVDLGYSDGERERAFALWQRFDDAAGAADAAAVAAWARTQPWCDGRAAYLGFCLGGRLAVKAAASVPAPLASFYGVRLDQELDALARLAAAGTPMQFHFGTADAHVPAATVSQVAATVAASPAAAVYTYEGAAHGFVNALRVGVHHPEATAQAGARLHAFLKDAFA